jgi:hypothetical protein
VRALKILVVAMGVLIVAGTVALVAIIVQRVGAAAGGGESPPLALRQPEGTRIAGIAAAEGRIAVWIVRPDGETRVLLVDPRTNRVMGEIRPGG